MDMMEEFTQNIIFFMPRTLYDKNNFVLDFESARVVFSTTRKMRDFLTDSIFYTKDEIAYIYVCVAELWKQKKILRRAWRIVVESGLISDV